MHVVVVGAGYVGLVSGVSLAGGGHRVTFVERDERRCAEIGDGRMPIDEPGLAATFASVRGRIRVVTSLEGADRADLVLVSVGTPIGDNGESDLGQLGSALSELRAHPDLDVSVRSTLPPGTSGRLPDLLGRTSAAHLSTNPEFLRQGSAMEDFARPTRIVIGRYPDTSAAHLAVVEQLYTGIEGPRLLVSVAAAELIKNAANAFLALKLSFVNELAALSEECGVEVDEVLEGIALDPRIGSAYMRPGLGFGGSCLPKELLVIAAAGRRRGLPMHIARAAALVNLEQQDRFVRRILDELPGSGARIGLLGLSFKAHTDDMRGSPAVHVARRLLESGHQVAAYDPAVRPARAAEAVPGVSVHATAGDVFRQADAVVIATEWPEFGRLDLPRLAGLTRRPLLFDGRGLVDPAVAARAGFAYRGIGRSSREAARVRVA